MREALSRSDSAVQSEECTLADIEAYTGVIPDRTGDYEAGRTVFHPSSEEFLDFLASRMHESD